LRRVDHFTRGLSASWFATLVTVFYGLASVPLALSYLSVEEFGLFMLVQQVAGYFALIELGTSGATARLLIDHKDNQSGKSYGSVITTGFLVLSIQGLIIMLLGLLGAPVVVHALGIPSSLQDTGVQLLRALCVTFAVGTAFKIFGSILYANKRLDFVNIIIATSVLVGMAIMAVVLLMGGGLRGLIIVFAVQALLTIILQALACWRLRLFPMPGHWGKPSWAQFMEMFHFAKDVFLVNLGTQLLEGSQLIIVTRTMGLGAAAMWSVGTKVFGLLYQLLTRLEGTAIVFFAEMMVRGETSKLLMRFRQIYQLTAGLATVSLGVAAAINKPFVGWWADPALAWPLHLSVLMGAVVFLNLLTRCHIDLIIHTKRLLALRYIYFLEALAFVGMAFFLGSKMGLLGVIVASLSCMLIVRLGYSSWRISRYFGVAIINIVWTWIRRPLLAVALMGPFVFISPFWAGITSTYGIGLLAVTIWMVVPAAIVLLYIALPRELAAELRQHLGDFVVSHLPRPRFFR
jgi:O-antigen/teichoic acid export membrane protein